MKGWKKLKISLVVHLAFSSVGLLEEIYVSASGTK